MREVEENTHTQKVSQYMEGGSGGCGSALCQGAMARSWLQSTWPAEGSKSRCCFGQAGHDLPGAFQGELRISVAGEGAGAPGVAGMVAEPGVEG